MTIRFALIAGIVALTASASVSAQNAGDDAFSASGASCDQITWSQESLQKFPFIATACQEVVLRDGKYYVRFEGDVERVADGGRELVFDFEDGGEATLYPPEGMTVNLDGRATPVRNLRRDDHLSLYIAQTRLEEQPFKGDIEPPPLSEPVPAAAPPPAPRPAPAAAAPAPQPAPAPAPVVEGEELAEGIPMIAWVGIALVVLVVAGLLLRRKK